MRYGLSKEVISEMQTVFGNHANIDKVILFGSRAKGNYREGSDIDFAICGRDISYTQLLDISNDIDDLGLLYKVDLIDYQKQRNTAIGEHINRVGQTFYQRNSQHP